jgi:hypothetical protein
VSADQQIERLTVLTSDCLQLLSEGNVEGYLALEGERRHLMDSLPSELPSECRAGLQNLSALTEALRVEVKSGLHDLSLQLPKGGTGESGSGFSITA